MRELLTQETPVNGIFDKRPGDIIIKMETKKKYAVGAIIGLELYLSDKIEQEVNDAIYKKLDETTED